MARRGRQLLHRPRFNLNFDLSALTLSLPDEVIIGVSFATQHQGTPPLRAPGPYDFLHVGLGARPPAVGVDVETDALLWNTANASAYADGGATGTAIFRRDTGWSPFSPAMRVNGSAYGLIAETAVRLRALTSTERKNELSLRAATTLAGLALVRNQWDGNSRLEADYGSLVFDLLAEATAELTAIIARGDSTVAQAAQARAALLDAAQSLSEMALGDAIISSGEPHRISRAQGALDDAFGAIAAQRPSSAIDEFAGAWAESMMAVR